MLIVSLPLFSLIITGFELGTDPNVIGLHLVHPIIKGQALGLDEIEFAALYLSNVEKLMRNSLN